MFNKITFMIRVLFLILITVILLWGAENIFRSVAMIKSIAIFEKILPCVDEIIPLDVIVNKMRKNQYRDIYNRLQLAWENDNRKFAVDSDFLSVGVGYSEIVFSKHKNFLPVFNISIPQLKRISTLIFILYLILYATAFTVILMLYFYRKSNFILLIYLYLFILGTQWLSLAGNQLSYLNFLTENKSENINWKKIKIGDKNLNFQWTEITPFIYLYKSDVQSETYLKQCNPHVNWKKISTNFWLCRYDSVIKLVGDVHALVLCIFLFWIGIYMYVLYKFAWCVTLFYRNKSLRLLLDK